MSPYTGSSKHEFTGFPMTAVHNNPGSVYEYELPRNRSSFCVQFLYFFAMKTAKMDVRQF